MIDEKMTEGDIEEAPVDVEVVTVVEADGTHTLEHTRPENRKEGGGL